jgi:hypothetical protein
MYIRQRKETKPIEVSEDFPSPKEDVKLEKKLPSGRWLELKQYFGLLFLLRINICHDLIG